MAGHGDMDNTEIAQEDASVDTEAGYDLIPPAPEVETWDHIAPKFKEARAALNKGLDLEINETALEETAQTHSSLPVDITIEKRQTRTMAPMRSIDCIALI
jgi:hypothetical protein